MPEVRSRSVATLVTRNITTNGKMPSSGAPIASNVGSRGRSTRAARRARMAHEHQRDGARVVTQLGEHAARGGGGAAEVHGRGSRRSFAVASARPVDEGQERGLDVGGAGRASSPARVSSASSRPSRRSSSRSQCAASSMTWLLTSSVAPRSARSRNSAHRSRRSTGSRPDRRLVEHEQLGVPSSAAASETRAPGRRRGGRRRRRRGSQADLVDDPVDVGARRAEDRREVAQVLPRRSGRRRPTAPG